MAYIAQKTRIASITINGQDVTDIFIGFVASDASGWRNGLISTEGEVYLAQEPTAIGVTQISDYSRSLFKRGDVVIITMRNPDGSLVRHPRGHLRVLTTSYDMQSERLVVSVGCLIALSLLTQDRRPLQSLLPIPLEPARNTIENYSASFWGAGKYVYQDNQGNLVVRKYFEGDTETSVSAGEWVSILGQTSLSVSPMLTSAVRPDLVKIAYEVQKDPEEAPEDSSNEGSSPNGGDDYNPDPFPDYEEGPDPGDGLPPDPNNIPDGPDYDPNPGADNTGYTDRVNEYSSYFFAYPTTVATRIPPEDDTDEGNENGEAIPDGDAITQIPEETVPVSGCGNTPAAPDTGANNEGDGDGINPLETTPEVVCSDTWETARQSVYLPAESIASEVNVYNGPAASISYTARYLYGPAVEVNPQYFADRYAYCTLVYGKGCNINGNCPYYGLNQILQSYSETFYTYNPEDGALIKTEEDVYRTTLSAAITENWRSGITNGKPEDFKTLNEEGMYRVTNTVVEYSETANLKTQTTTTYTSVTSRGTGIASGANLDAKSGIRTTTRRMSTDNSNLSAVPDFLNSPVFEVEEFEDLELVTDFEGLEDFAFNDDAYQFEDIETEGDNPQVIDDDFVTFDVALPVPLPGGDPDFIEQTVEDFKLYANRFVKGQSAGIQLAEALRPDIIDTWYPGVSIRYADIQNDVVLALRLDATTWGVDREESIVAGQGLLMGYSSGTVSLGSNLVGNSRPNMQGGAPTPPSLVETPPSIGNDVVGVSIAQKINVHLFLDTNAFVYGFDGVLPINPTDLTAKAEMAFVPYCSGFIVETGGLLDYTPTPGSFTGSIPIEYNGSIVSPNAVIVDADLFS